MARGRNNKRKRLTPEPEEQDMDRFAGSSEEEEGEEEESLSHVEAETNEMEQTDDSMGEQDEYTGSASKDKKSSSLGMAGAMARILSTNQSKSKSVVLSKTTTRLQRQVRQERLEQQQLKEKRKINRQFHLQALHVPLSVATSLVPMESSSGGLKAELEQERLHRRIATRGVVALFNAIAQHQQQQQGGTMETKNTNDNQKSIHNKHGFLDLIKSKAAEPQANPNEKKETTALVTCTLRDTNTSTRVAQKDKKPKWNALQDDFMLNSKLKDWDKESSQEEDNSMEQALNDEWSDDNENTT